MYEKDLTVLTPKIVINTVPKNDLMIVLPYLGKLTLQIRTMINCEMTNKLSQQKFALVKTY